MKYKKSIAGVILGATAGYAYWYFVGCASGTCAITSSPVNSTIYGTLMGFLAANTFEGKDKTTKDNKVSES